MIINEEVLKRAMDKLSEALIEIVKQLEVATDIMLKNMKKRTEAPKGRNAFRNFVEKRHKVNKKIICGRSCLALDGICIKTRDCVFKSIYSIVGAADEIATCPYEAQDEDNEEPEREERRIRGNEKDKNRIPKVQINNEETG